MFYHFHLSEVMYVCEGVGGGSSVHHGETSFIHTWPGPHVCIVGGSLSLDPEEAGDPGKVPAEPPRLVVMVGVSVRRWGGGGNISMNNG